MGASAVRSPSYGYVDNNYYPRERNRNREGERDRDRLRDWDREKVRSTPNRRHKRRSSSVGPRVMQQDMLAQPIPPRNFSRSPYPPASMNNDYAILQPPPPLYDPSAYPSRRQSQDSYRSRPNTPGTYDLDSPSSAGSRRASRTFTPRSLTDDSDLTRSSDSLTPPAVSTAPTSRSTLTKTPTSTTSSINDKQARRKSFFGAVLPPTLTKEPRETRKRGNYGPPAWIVGHSPRVAFDVEGLVAGQPMHDIWDPNGNCLVYLQKDKGPSFRIQASVLSSSAELAKKVFGEEYVNAMNAPAGVIPPTGQRLNFTPPTAYTWQQSRSSTPDSHQLLASAQYGSPNTGDEPGLFPLYLDVPFDNDKPLYSDMDDGRDGKRWFNDGVEGLIVYRNLFAFLTGQSLVATGKRHNLFAIFMCLSNLLKRYRFKNASDTNFGEVAATSFDEYVKELNLADVRTSREKTIEGLVLGERMRSQALYNEAYTHAVGKLEEIVALKSQSYSLISPDTVNRMGRAAIDLGTRIGNIRLILTNFDFPDVISLLDNSKSSDERKSVNFDAWHRSFDATRKFYMNFYKKEFGSWPPKANSKKNNLETSGLSRPVLQRLYADLCELYDLLVDRHDLTNRTADGVVLDSQMDTRPTARAMRRILGEYDISSPPVKPPVPFDLPKTPSLRSIHPGFGNPANKKKDAKLLSKKLKTEDVNQIIRASHNIETRVNPFLEAFKKYELKAASNCDLTDVIDLRMGQWLFMYAVLQALPLLVMDAPDVVHSQGVEYFLCAVPRSGVPWATTTETRTKMNWYGIAGGGGMVSLPTDVIENSVDGIYRRSHCWEMADRWTASDPSLNSAVREQQSTFSPSVADARSAAPGTIAAALGPEIRSSNSIRVGGRRARSMSPGARKARQSIINLGLQALPVPAGVTPEQMAATPRGTARDESMAPPQHEVDATRTFEAMLSDEQFGNKKKKGGR